MYKVWFNGFIDRYYKSYENAREACRRFIISQKKNEVVALTMLEELDQFDEVEKLCGIAEIKFEDETDELAPKVGKTKYKVIFKKSEVVEVLAYNKEEAEALADVALDNIAFCWEGPADEIIVEEI